ncbi:hypothetical protein SAMN05421847_1080 [Halpernia humi]|uniref:Uncharacterized protein n=1 Tax=Halpernia humi TaxID=493375 RepID=A0A1H5W2M3_9FLAO|nr:hypothetical protein [Halpernia humi]SEF93643.1 hypothetical protein SAMN05421847_1080 [Halpernia humi]
MKNIQNLFIFIFSVGILILPTQNLMAQNMPQAKCCTSQSVCHNNMPAKNHKNSTSHDCCSVSICVFQFINSAESISTECYHFNNFKKKLSFFYSHQLLPNTYLEGVFQPPKFI